MIHFIKKKLKSSSVLKNLMVLVSGTALAQLIGIVASPLLSRLYTPESFGQVGLIMSIVGVLSVVSSLKYEMALVVEQDDHKAKVIQRLCWDLLLITTGLVAVGCVAALLWWHWTDATHALQAYLPWVLPILFLTGLFNIYNFRLNRERKYKELSKAGVVRRLVLVLTQIILGFCGAQAAGLIMGNLLGGVVAVLVLFLSNRELLSFAKYERSEVRDQAKEHYRFAAYSAPQNLVNALSQSLPIYLLGYFYGVEIVGAYWFAMRLLQLPASLIGGAVRQVFYKEASEKKDDKRALYSMYKKTVALLTALIAGPVLLVFFFGKELFVYVFGSEWAVAGEFSSWMFLWVAVGFVTAPSVCLFNACGLQKGLAIYEVILAVARTAVLLIGGFCWGSLGTVIGYSAVGVVFNLYLVLYWLFGSSKHSTT